MAHLEKLLLAMLERVRKVQAVPKSTLTGEAKKKAAAAEEAALNCWPYDMEYMPCTADPSRTCLFVFWMCDDGRTFTTEEPV